MFQPRFISPWIIKGFEVCSLIEESEVLQLQTAEETYLNMQAHFKDLKVGLVHGRMKSSEKQKVMSDFVKGNIQLLVATTVIEVGVDWALRNNLISPAEYSDLLEKAGLSSTDIEFI